MSTALEEIEFLARSENRIAVLETLSQGPHERSELREATEISQSTLARIIDELETRVLIRRDGYQYETTPLGAIAIAELSETIEAMGTVGMLREVIEWMPTDGMEFDLRELNDATITTPTQAEVIAPVRRLTERLREGTQTRVLSHALAGENLVACHEAVTEGTQEFEAVFSPNVIEIIATDAELTRCAQEMQATDRATFFEYEGDQPYTMSIFETTTAIPVVDDQQMVHALIETENEAVHSWAMDTYEDYRSEAVRVDVTDLTSSTGDA